jgi:hypothetical protein
VFTQFTTYHPQANAIIEQVHKVVNDMLRSFALENKSNHENLEEKDEDNPFHYFLQSTAGLLRYQKHISHRHYMQHHVNLCLAET